MPASNPLATRFTRPGAIDYLFPAGQSAQSLVARLAEQDWQGEIVGPHGSGKSTLLATLVPALKKAGREVVWRAIRIPTDSRPPTPDARLPAEEVPPTFAAVTAGSESWTAATLLVLDGYEQLSWWWRRRVRALCRRRGAGLLVTAHQPLDLPLLARTQPSEALAQQVVARLLAGREARITPADVSAAFKASGGNVRETLFALYDVYQSRR